MKTTKGNVPRRVNPEAIYESSGDLYAKIMNNDITIRQGNTAITIIAGMNRITELEMKILKKSTPELLEKMELEVKKTTARIKRFKEVSPNIHFKAFEEWLKNNQVE